MRNRRFIFIILLMLVWVSVIFLHSMQPASRSSAESLLVMNLLNRLLPFRLTNSRVRKLAHFTEFAVLGFLSSLAYHSQRGETRLWKGLALAYLLGETVALCDETIQIFVAGRSGQIRDVWIDTAGAFAGGFAALMLVLTARTVSGWFRRSG